MKKYLLQASLIFLAAAPLFAVPWGVLGHEESAQSAGKGEKERGFTNNLINELYNGAQITYCVQSDAPKSPANILPALIEDAFNSWLDSTRQYIEASGRSREFADLLPALDRKINLKQVDCPCVLDVKPFTESAGFKFSYPCLQQGEEPKIFFITGQNISSVYGNNYSSAFYTRDDKTGRHLVVADTGGALYSSLQHEIGHALGLGDQYERSLYNSLPQTGARDEQPSIMDSAAAIECDDAEGIINLIDCFRRPPAEPFFRGGDKGWKSICPGREIVYAKCLAQNRADERVISAGGDFLNMYKYDESGRLKKRERIKTSFYLHPYNVYDKRSYSKQERDGSGRLKYLKDLQGNETFFEYNEKGFSYKTISDSGFAGNRKTAIASV